MPKILVKEKEIIIGPFNKAGVFALESAGHEVKRCHFECNPDGECYYGINKECPYAFCASVK